MKNIYIIRHGQTDFNVRLIIQGRGINSDLNDEGLKQAKAFFDKYHPVDFDVVYTSALKRTHQTVSHFIAQNIPHEIRDSIDEISWGNFEGKEHEESLKETFYAIVDEWRKGNLTIKIDGGESAQDLADRLMPFVEEIKNSTHENILVCTHGRTLRVLICLLTNTPVSKMDSFEHTNTCLYKLRYDGTLFHLELENDIVHLSSN